MNYNIIVSFVSFIASLSSIIFALLAYKKTERQEHKKEGKNEGIILSDIGYIKACVDRVDKNLTKLDEKYKNIVERLVKTEEQITGLSKRVDLLEGG
ncbi:MAG: hypothetical protein IKC22_04890 [Bacilli bacterium]|nr:hypothetical protein [Bacilli bacterium]